MQQIKKWSFAFDYINTFCIFALNTSKCTRENTSYYTFSNTSICTYRNVFNEKTMATIAEKMAVSMEELRKLQEQHPCVVLQGTKEIGRTHRI